MNDEGYRDSAEAGDGSAIARGHGQELAEQSNSRRRFRVRVVAAGYATVLGKSKAEAIRNARTGDFVTTPRPEWSAQISDIEEDRRS